MRRTSPLLSAVCVLTFSGGVPWLRVGATAAAADGPVLRVQLGEVNEEHGLVVPSGGDGVNTPLRIAGVEARRTDASRASYLYVRIDDTDAVAGAEELYVTVDVLDDDFRWVQLQYDRRDPDPDLASKYTKLPRSLLLTGSGEWVRRHFALPHPRLGHGQNHGTDFRLSGSGLTVRRIEVRTSCPPDYTPGSAINEDALARLRVNRRPQLEITFGNDAGPDEAVLLKALGVTSVESYVDWASVEKIEGQWDWSVWDRQVTTLEEAGLRWVPFLLVGMPYATPMWFQESDRSAYYVCLEHGKENRTQTLFNPRLPTYVDRYLAEFAERYRDRGVIESILLGITGIYGESIYPAGPDGGGWTARLNGAYHNHMGWWAGDSLARQAFRQAMTKRYRTVAALNAAWGTDYAGVEAVTTFLPANAPNDRAAADMAQWYQQAMTDWAVLWVGLARKHFPDTEIYLCTGGRGTPELGADFSAQAKAISPLGAGIRITNEGSNYAHNFTHTREVATATRFYGTFAGFEPAGPVDPVGVSARIYNAVASAARQLHYYHPNVLAGNEALTRFRDGSEHLVVLRPEVAVAFYVSRETWEVDVSRNDPMYVHARALRDVTDFDMVTRTTVRDGILPGYRALVLTESPVLEPDVAALIEEWVNAGGILLSAGDGGLPGSRLHNLADWRARLLPAEGGRVSIRYTLGGEAPAYWQLHIGTPDDEGWLFGDWHQREHGTEWPDDPTAHKRWSGRRAGIRVPVHPGVGHGLVLDAHLSGHSLASGRNTVSVNGHAVGVLDRAGSHRYRFAIPANALAGESVAEVMIDMQTWCPVDHGSTDKRDLGVALRMVEIVRDGVHVTKPASARLLTSFDPETVRPLVRRVGKGAVVDLHGQGGPDTVWAVGAEILGNTSRYVPESAPVVTVDGQVDGRFATTTDRGIYWYSDREGIVVQTPAEAKSQNGPDVVEP